MIDVVGIVFSENGHVYYFAPAGLPLKKNLIVVVETERGLQAGKMVTDNIKIKKENLNLPLKRVIRIATQEDLINKDKNDVAAKEALKKCEELVEKHKLDMRIIDANFTLDRKQLLFHFIADARIDFRNLAKDLASIYKTRIELRQVGVRDKAREIGGIGPCGRLLCCAQFLYDFDTVSINMAKNQNIALNPNKINGACGRLLCCLTYENDQYIEARKDMPELNKTINTEKGLGKVIAVDILNKKYKVLLDNNDVITIEKDSDGSN